MGYLKWANEKIREELDYWDIKLMKTTAQTGGYSLY
jgi:hypothetical protein